MIPGDRLLAEFWAASGTLEDRLGHQSVWKSGNPADYVEHVKDCTVCRDLDAGGDGLGGRR